MIRCNDCGVLTDECLDRIHILRRFSLVSASRKEGIRTSFKNHDTRVSFIVMVNKRMKMIIMSVLMIKMESND